MTPTVMAQLPEAVTVDTVTATLEKLTATLQQSAEPNATVDAGTLRNFDSSAVALLLELRRSLALQGRRLQVVNLPRKLQELVALYGVSELLPA